MASLELLSNTNAFWIFGYGSLIWKPNFPYEKRVIGYIKNWRRRFYQGSTDHRGIPGAPGRVVTLVSNEVQDFDEKGNLISCRLEECITWGAAYCIPEHKVQEVINYLDYREKGGYTQAYVDVYDHSDSEEPKIRGALIYMGTETNSEYLGPASLDVIANQILRSHGPSGPNIEYLLNLAKALHEMGVIDNHVFELETRCLELMKRLKDSNEI